MSSDPVIPFASASRRGALAIATIGVVGVCQLATAFIRVGDLPILRRGSDAAHLAELHLLSQRSGPVLIELTSLCFTLMSAVFFLAWFHRVHRNLPALGARNLEYSPRWAVGGFFVPILNLWRPLTVMTEVRENSAPRDPSDTTGSEVLQGVWWTAFIGAEVLSRRLGSLEMRPDPDVSAYFTATALYAAGSLVNVIAAIAVIALVREIDRNQRRRHRLLEGRERTEGLPAPDAACGSCGAVLTRDAKRCGFCGGRRPGAAIGCGTVMAWGASGLVLLIALVAWLGLGTLQLIGSPPTRVQHGSHVSTELQAYLLEENALEPDEELLWFYSTGLLSAEEMGDLLTDRRVVSYYEWDPDSPPVVYAVDLEDIVDVDVSWGTSWTDTQVTIVHELDPGELDDPEIEVEAGEETVRDTFSVALATERGGDRAFVETLRDLLGPDVPIDEPSVPDEAEQPTEALPSEVDGTAL